MDKPTNPLDLEEIKGLMERARHRPGAPGWHLHDSHFFSWLADQGVSHETIAYMKAAKSVLPTLIEQYERMRAELIEWRECAQYDALMEGPVFKGWDRSALDRCRRRFVEAAQQEETNGYRS